MTLTNSTDIKKFEEVKQILGPLYALVNNTPSNRKRNVELLIKAGLTPQKAEELYQLFLEKISHYYDSSMSAQDIAEGIKGQAIAVFSMWKTHEMDAFVKILTNINPELSGTTVSAVDRFVLQSVSGLLAKSPNKFISGAATVLKTVAGQNKIPFYLQPVLAPVRLSSSVLKGSWNYFVPSIIKAPFNVVAEKLKTAAKRTAGEAATELAERTIAISVGLDQTVNIFILTMAVFAFSLSLLLVLKHTKLIPGVVVDPNSRRRRGVDLISGDTMYLNYFGFIPATFCLPYKPGQWKNKALYYILRVIYFVHVNGTVYGIIKLIVVVFIGGISTLLPTQFKESVSTIIHLNEAMAQFRTNTPGGSNG